MSLFTTALCGLALFSLLFDTPALAGIPVLVILMAALVTGLLVGMGRPRPSLALGLAGTICAIFALSTPALVVLAAAAGAAWGRPRKIGILHSLPLLVPATLGLGAALGPDGAFDPALAAGLGGMGLGALALAPIGPIGASLAGAGVALAWGLAGFGGAGILGGLALAMVALCARRIPGRALCMALGLALGGMVGMLVGLLTGVSTPESLALPWWAGLVVAIALIPMISGVLHHSHAGAVLVCALVASFWAPLGAAPGLAALALGMAALCARRRASLFGSEPASITSASLSAPWLRKIWGEVGKWRATSHVSPASSGDAVVVRVLSGKTP